MAGNVTADFVAGNVDGILRPAAFRTATIRCVDISICGSIDGTNAPPDRPCRIVVDDGSSLSGESRRIVELPVCDQYTLQGDDFSRAIRLGHAQPLPLEDSVANMRVLDAIVRSASSVEWERPD